MAEDHQDQVQNQDQDHNQNNDQARVQEHRDAANFRRQRTADFAFEQMLWNDHRLLSSYRYPPKPQSLSTSARSLALTMLAQNHPASGIGTVIPSPHPTHLFALYLGPPSDLLYPLTTNMSLYLIFWAGWTITELVRQSLSGVTGIKQVIYEFEVERRGKALAGIREFGLEMFCVAKREVGADGDVDEFAERVKDVIDEMVAEVDVEIGLVLDVAAV